MNAKPIVLFAALLSAPVAQSDDFLSIYKKALNSDTAFLAADFQRKVAGEDVLLAESVFKPTIDLSGNMNYQDEEIKSQGAKSSDNYTALGLDISLNQTIYSQQNTIAITQSKLGNEQAGFDLETASDDLILRIASTYFTVLGAQDNLDLAVSEKIAIKRQLELAEERLNVGIGTQTDLFDAQARFQIVEAEEIGAENLIEDSMQALISIIGFRPTDLSVLREDSPLVPPQPNNVSTWVESANANNPALHSEKLAYEISNQEVEKQRKIKTPTVSWKLGQTFSDNGGSASSGFGSDRSATTIGLQLSVPLYTSGTDRVKVRSAALNANVQEQVLEQVRRSVTRNVRNLFNDVTTGIRRVNALQQAVVASESAVEAKNEGFSAGLITNLDVLDAQRDLFQAQRDYLRARYDYILAVLNLEQAAGQLDVDDVIRVNSWLKEPATG